MISEAMQKGLNDQIQCEFHSAYVYLAMVAKFETLALPGCASWMEKQAREEAEHAMRLFEHVTDRGGVVTLSQIDAPGAVGETAIDIFDAALKHEQYVTKRIHELFELAQKEGDYPAQTMLHWFIDEQVEEVKTATENLDQFTRAGSNETSLLMLDQQMAQRSSTTEPV